jgi:hypothetical protein
MTPHVRTALVAAARPYHRPSLLASLDTFERWVAFVNFAGVGQTYQQRIRSLGGLGKAVMKFEVMQ